MLNAANCQPCNYSPKQKEIDHLTFQHVPGEAPHIEKVIIFIYLYSPDLRLRLEEGIGVAMWHGCAVLFKERGSCSNMM